MNEALSRAVNRLCKWRMVFAGWQLGTRTDKDPECQAVRDHRDLSMLLRAEVSSITAILIRKRVFSLDDLHEQLILEADLLCQAYERRFPGFKATEQGIVIDPIKAAETTKGWRP